MRLSAQAVKWLSWLILTIAIAFWLGFTMFSESTDKTIFMPGPLSDGHHQLAEACDACHIDSFGGGEVLQQACVDCHGDERVKPFDSHPAKKFKDPRNAELLENINALTCITCHTEHKQEITKKDGLTQPVDFCVHCHQDVAEERPSHEGMDFMTCKDSGCHNFHNNRALYTNYLIKHLHEQPMLSTMILPEKEFTEVLEEVVEYPRDKYPVQPLTAADIDVDESIEYDDEINRQWLASGHARSGVNCTACHVEGQSMAAPETDLEAADSEAADSEETDSETTVTAATDWNDHPDHNSCKSCHAVEVERFTEGKHGMRLKHEFSAMTPAMSRLPMHQDAAHQQLTCNSCHGAHEYDVQQAAVESCLTCHADEHSLAYKESPHYATWQAELDGTAEPGSGVSCASCHMPRINHDVSEWMSRTIVDHNQSANLSPNTKMIRSSCQHCHGLEFVLDTLADEEQIRKNFNGRTDNHIQTMDLADREKQRRDAASSDDDADMFGF